jgi:hypothetical protein
VSPVELADGRGEGGDGEEPNHVTVEKAWSSINYLILFAMNILTDLYLEQVGASSQL